MRHDQQYPRRPGRRGESRSQHHRGDRTPKEQADYICASTIPKKALSIAQGCRLAAVNNNRPEDVRFWEAVAEEIRRNRAEYIARLREAG